MTVLVDLNILLDVVLERLPWADEATRLFDGAADGRYELVVAASSVPNLFYIARRARGLKEAFAAVDMCLESFRIIEMTEDSLREARNFAGSDFEDNIQIAAAVAAKGDYIVSRDLEGFKSSRIPVMNTLVFIRQF